MNNSNTDEYKDLDSKILELYNRGITNAEIARMLNCSTNTVWRHLKRHNIYRLKITKTSIDWKEIQIKYDNGLSESDLRKLGYVKRSQLDKAKKNGDFVPRSKDEMFLLLGEKLKQNTHTDEAKDKISRAMIKRHANGTAYTLGHNERLKKRSYPEQWFESVIKDRLIDQAYEAQYRLGRYCLDFAWIGIKKCVEVDGETHYRFQSEIDKDLKRDKWLKEQGWHVIRFRWKNVISNKEKSIIELKKFIDGV